MFHVKHLPKTLADKHDRSTWNTSYFLSAKRKEYAFSTLCVYMVCSANTQHIAANRYGFEIMITAHLVGILLHLLSRIGSIYLEK